MSQHYSAKRVFKVTWALGLFATIAIHAPASAQFLPAAGFNTGASTNNQYGANLANFNQNVIDHGQNVGTISFNYNTYGGTPTGGAGFTGGGALAGQFVANPAAVLTPGYTIAWCQTVTATISGTNEWGAANGTEFPDTNNGKTNPAYPFQSLPNGNVAVQPSANFQDFPNRFPNAGNQTWVAELALVAENNTAHQAQVIESFLWGFGVTNANPGTIANITPLSPNSWSAPTNSFMNTEINSFNGQNGSVQWNFGTGQAFNTPEPGSVTLCTASLFVFSTYGWRRTRKKQRQTA